MVVKNLFHNHIFLLDNEKTHFTSHLAIYDNGTVNFDNTG